MRGSRFGWGDANRASAVDSRLVQNGWRVSRPHRTGTARQLRNLVAAYIAAERRGAAARTVREFIFEFRGLSGTAIASHHEATGRWIVFEMNRSVGEAPPGLVGIARDTLPKRFQPRVKTKRRDVCPTRRQRVIVKGRLGAMTLLVGKPSHPVILSNVDRNDRGISLPAVSPRHSARSRGTQLVPSSPCRCPVPGTCAYHASPLCARLPGE